MWLPIMDEESLKLALQLQAADDAEADRLRQERQAEDHRNDQILAELLAQELNQGAAPGNNAAASNTSSGNSNGPLMPSSSQAQPTRTGKGPQEVDTRGGNRRFKNMRAGENIVIRLHHPHSGSHIGESLRAQYLSTSEVRFELVNDPGKFLLVSETGKVEFKQCEEIDACAGYRFELTLNDRVYLKCSAHMNKINIAGESCWFLALTADGQLIGNSNRGPAAQWSLVASEDQQAFGTSTGSSSSSSSSTLSGRLSAFNPFGKKEATAAPTSSSAVVPEDTEKSETSAELADSEVPDAHLNPLLFQNADFASPPPAPTPAPASVLTSAAITTSPQYSAFIATLSPGLSAAIAVDPYAFVRAIQSPELWALLDVLPNQASDSSDSTAINANLTSMEGAVQDDETSMHELSAKAPGDTMTSAHFGEL